MVRNENEKKEILSEAAKFYAFDLNDAIEIPGHEGGRNLVYRIGEEAILRISTLQDRVLEDYKAEIEYVHFLAENGAPVADTLLSKNQRRIEVIHDSVVSMFEVARGEQIADHVYQYREGVPIEEYFFNTGKVLGKIHALSKTYTPQIPRFDFFDKYNEPYLESLIPDEFLCMRTVTGRQIKDALFDRLKQLRALDKSQQNYGMVHFDYSDGNYNIEYDTGAIHVFDFDNCRTCWYLFDIANLWSHGFGWIAWNADSRARREYMDRYMETVKNGYRTECEIADAELNHLELMVNAVLMEKASWFGFYSDFFSVESPFEVEF